MKMPAVVNYAPERGAVEIREIPKPEIGEDDVLLEVSQVGVCGSDLHQWTADHSWSVNYPVVLGHEFGGTIAAIGERVEALIFALHKKWKVSFEPIDVKSMSASMMLTGKIRSQPVPQPDD